MDRSTRHRQSEAPRIPLRPELVEFMDVKSLCQYQCCSKACGKDVREANAWSLLAGVQAPRSVREALESDALSRVRSQTLRRLLADALAEPSQPLRPSQFRDFTFFVRIADGGRMIWEGDLQMASNACIDLTLTNVTSHIKRSGACPKLIDFLAKMNTTSTQDEAALEGITITLIAIRDVDQAMVSIGKFPYYDHADGDGDPDQMFLFTCREALFAVPGFNFEPHLLLETRHDSDGDGELISLRLGVDINSIEAEYDRYVDHLDNSQIQYLLTYLAGVPRTSVRDEALRTIRSWVS
jgi:hypothetical protein